MPTLSKSSTRPRFAHQGKSFIYAPMESVEQSIGRAIGGLQEGTVRQALKRTSPESWSRRLVIACRILIERGERHRAEALVEELFGLFNSAPQPVLCTALLLEEADADAELAKARARFELDETPEHAITYCRALQRHESKERAVALALRELQSA